MRPNLSIVGLYNYDNTIFDGLQLPQGVERELVVNKIMTDNAELSLVYTDPEIIKMMIINWSAIHVPNWTRVKAALDAEYDPISNYDRHEEWTDTGESSSTQTTATERKVAGYNTAPVTDTAEAVENTGTGSGDTSSSHDGHIYGNIGVTTAQQMINEELQLRKSATLEQIISDSFRSNFCIMIY